MTKSKKYLNLACGDYFISSETWINLDWAPKSKKVKQANLLESLPFDDNTFDFVYCSHFLEHISRKDLVNFLSECNRVLKSNGRARFVLPDFENIAREYIRNIDNNFLKFAEFNIIEMIDQCVRKESGGELNEWYKNSFDDTELGLYIRLRTGFKNNQNRKKAKEFARKFRNLTIKKIYFRKKG